MRLVNPYDIESTFTPLEPGQMVRIALICGMQEEKYGQESQRYRNLVKEYSCANAEMVDKLFSLINTPKRTEKQQRFLDALLTGEFHYKNGFWKKFSYADLKREEVIIEHKGDARSLVELMINIDNNKVVHYLGHVAEPEIDYVKHVPQWNKLCLNSPEVIKEFAKRKALLLPESYLKTGRFNSETLELLALAGFTFREALTSAFNVLQKNENYKNRKISTLYVRNPTSGDELRFHHNDWIQAAERFWHRRITKERAEFDFIEPNKYSGTKIIRIPKVTPVGLRTGELKTHNSVETHYLPDLREVNEKNCLDWMHYSSRCDCDHGVNLRNFEEKKGNKKRVVLTQDQHGGELVLEILSEIKQRPNNSPNNTNPIPTPEFSREMDKWRYQLFEVFERKKNGEKIEKASEYVKQAALDILANELAKIWPIEKMYFPNRKIKEFIIRNFYDF